MIILGTQATYDGAAHGPVYSVKDGTTVLNKGTDYIETSGFNPLTNVGNMTLGISGAGNYTGEAIATWSLVAKDVTITPTSGLSKTYGEADPTLTYTTSIDGDTTLKNKFDADKSGALSYTGTDAGDYPIELGTLKAGNNFNLKMVTPAVNFTIDKKNADSLTAYAPYDQTTIKGVGTFIEPIVYGVDGAVLTGTISYDVGTDHYPNTAAVVAKLKTMPAGGALPLTYHFVPTSTNYIGAKTDSILVTVKDIEFLVGTAHATVANTLTVKADPTYGDDWSDIVKKQTGVTITARVGAVTDTDQSHFTLRPTDKPSAGNETYELVYNGTINGTNYANVVVVSGNVTVARKEVTVSGITAADKVYDGNNSAMVNVSTATITGKKTGDDLTVSVAAGSTFDSADAGSRTVTLGTLTLGGTSAGNYTLATAGNQTEAAANITARDLTVKPDSGQHKTFGDADPALTYAYSGEVSGETPVFDSALSRETGEDVGTYNITKGSLALKDSGTFKATNYNLVLDTAAVTFEIAKGTYGGSTPTKTVNILKNYAGVQTGTLTAADFFTIAPAEAKITNAVPNSTPSNMMSLAGADSSGNFTYASQTNITAASNENWTITISSKNYTDIFAKLTFSPVDKTDVGTQITFPDGTLTYNGAGQKYEKATTSTTAAGTPVWTYIYAPADATASLDSAGLPKTAGTYTVTAKYEDDAHIGTKNATLTINKATPTGEPAYTKITTSGKTLKDAGLTVTGSTLNPNAGTLEWVDDAGNVLHDTTTVAANTTYKWRFTPADANYTTLTGSIKLYHKSSSSGGGSSHSSRYAITVDKTENGTITISPKSASKGDTVTITVKPDKGYELDTLKVLDKDGDKVKFTEKKGKYTFTMPASKVTVKGKFVEEAPEQIFADVPVDAYCYEAVKWAASEGITGGIGNNLFAPGRPCTRGQIVTFLWRAAGSPAPKSMSSFTDIAEDAYYAKAVAWAVENGITGGTGNGKFSPDATCTRAQAVTFLYRASGSPAVSGSAAFSDVAADAYYASAVKWAEKNGITGGIGGGLFGSGNNCTRGQIVTFLYRSVK